MPAEQQADHQRNGCQHQWRASNDVVRLDIKAHQVAEKIVSIEGERRSIPKTPCIVYTTSQRFGPVDTDSRPCRSL